MVGTESVRNGDNPPEKNLDFDWWDIIVDGEDPFVAAGFSDPSPDSLPLSIGGIEQILLDDDDDFALVTGEGSFEEQNIGFDWSSLLLDSPWEASDSKRSSGGSEVEERDRVDPFPQKVDDAVQVLLESENDDPVTKKRKRQLRNRDAAVRSRERKKMYVRDLELKSKCFESECTRLGVMLQFCLAENQVLRFCLENNKKAVGASSSRQESAVLLLESLLLGSLLWSLDIITCLLILPSRLLSTLLRVLPQEGEEDKNQASRIKVGREKKSIRTCVIPSMLGKRYKASRSRLKSASVPAAQTNCCVREYSSHQCCTSPVNNNHYGFLQIILCTVF